MPITTILSGQKFITNYLQAATNGIEALNAITIDTANSSSDKRQTQHEAAIQQMPIRRRRIIVDDDDIPESADAGGKASEGCAVPVANADVEITHETPAQAPAAMAIMPETDKGQHEHQRRPGKHKRNRTRKRRSHRRSRPTPLSTVSRQMIELLIFY